MRNEKNSTTWAKAVRLPATTACHLWAISVRLPPTGTGMHDRSVAPRNRQNTLRGLCTLIQTASQRSESGRAPPQHTSEPSPSSSESKSLSESDIGAALDFDDNFAFVGDFAFASSDFVFVVDFAFASSRGLDISFVFRRFEEVSEKHQRFFVCVILIIYCGICTILWEVVSKGSHIKDLKISVQSYSSVCMTDIDKKSLQSLRLYMRMNKMYSCWGRTHNGDEIACFESFVVIFSP